MKITAKNLVKSFGEPAQEVLHGISFEVQSGEFVALTGRSGSGKSTLLYALSTLDEPTSGEVWYNDQRTCDWTSKQTHEFRNQNLGFVFQFHYLLPELTVLENVLLPAMKIKQEAAKRDRALELLQSFDLKNKQERFPSQLSGGEQQRVAIARALIMNPKILFADEPTGNLDSQNGDVVMNYFREINRSEKTTIMLITHDSDFAERADRKIELVDGHLAKN